jgi:hypothetical protein
VLAPDGFGELAEEARIEVVADARWTGGCPEEPWRSLEQVFDVPGRGTAQEVPIAKPLQEVANRDELGERSLVVRRVGVDGEELAARGEALHREVAAPDSKPSGLAARQQEELRVRAGAAKDRLRDVLAVRVADQSALSEVVATSLETTPGLDARLIPRPRPRLRAVEEDVEDHERLAVQL